MQSCNLSFVFIEKSVYLCLLEFVCLTLKEKNSKRRQEKEKSKKDKGKK